MILTGECHFSKSDIFSFGVLLYNLLLPYKIDPITSKILNPPIIGFSLIRETMVNTLSKLGKDLDSLPEETLDKAYNNISYFDILIYKELITEKILSMRMTGTHKRIFILIHQMTLFNDNLRPTIQDIKNELDEIRLSLII
jgi:hypothetical protein